MPTMRERAIKAFENKEPNSSPSNCITGTLLAEVLRPYKSRPLRLDGPTLKLKVVKGHVKRTPKGTSLRNVGLVTTIRGWFRAASAKLKAHFKRRAAIRAFRFPYGA